MKIVVDGSETTSMELELDPRKHVVKASAEGRVPFETSVDLAEGQRSEIVIALDPTPSARGANEAAVGSLSSPPPTRTEQQPSIPLHPVWTPISLSTFGLGVLALGGGALFALRASAGRDDSGCRDGQFCPDKSSADRLRDAKSDADIATGFVITAAVLAAAGAVMFFTLARPKSN